MEALLILAASTVINIVLLLAFRWWTGRQPVRPLLLDAEVLQAMEDACLTVGLPKDQFAPSYDVARTGKLQDVLHHASAKLGVDHRLRTVGDVAAYLQARGV